MALDDKKFWTGKMLVALASGKARELVLLATCYLSTTMTNSTFVNQHRHQVLGTVVLSSSSYCLDRTVSSQ